MKAVQLKAFGGIENLVTSEVEKPTITSTQILINTLFYDTHTKSIIGFYSYLLVSLALEKALLLKLNELNQNLTIRSGTFT
ncbi:hypothetical protein LCX57_001191 [Vibrio parahaemolyticus]|nr:hypothetical protein [Vibrio parahaemolyticus]EJC6985846.1 hypothetical protein [Vibrio parahaemolyticus]EJG1902228.1 hypothetical protein [Vibrio parahaemolyticus]EJO2024072.1 hypothetical protein [Vibrio parahaemolyticus]